jgi:hypothetical protein
MDLSDGKGAISFFPPPETWKNVRLEGDLLLDPPSSTGT